MFSSGFKGNNDLVLRTQNPGSRMWRVLLVVYIIHGEVQEVVLAASFIIRVRVGSHLLAEAMRCFPQTTGKTDYFPRLAYPNLKTLNLSKAQNLYPQTSSLEPHTLT